MEGLAAKSPYFQEFHCVLRQQALGLLMRPMNSLAVVQGLRRDKNKTEEEDENKMAAEKAGVSVGSILVAVNSVGVSHLDGFDAAIAKVKAAGRPVTLGFRVLHPVRDPNFAARRLWQGLLFQRFSLGRSWTGKFFVLREDGNLDSFPSKEYAQPVETLRLALGSTVRCTEKEIAEAARAMADLGDDGRGSLGPRVLALPVLSDSPDTDVSPVLWAFFRADTADAKDDWLMALTTLNVIHEQSRKKKPRHNTPEKIKHHNENDANTFSVDSKVVSAQDSVKKNLLLSSGKTKGETNFSSCPPPASVSKVPRILSSELERQDLVEAEEKGKAGSQPSEKETKKREKPPGASDIEMSQDQDVTMRQGYMWMKVSTKRAGRKEKAAEFALRLEPWRRRWFVLRSGSLRWYASPPADEHEVPSGILRLRNAIVTVARLEHDMIVYNDQDLQASPATTNTTANTKSEKFELRVLEAARSHLEDRIELTLRCPSEQDGADWVRLLRGDTVLSAAELQDSAGRRMQRLRRHPELAVEAPEVAYAVLVPVDRSDGGVDRDAWRQVAGYHLTPLCDVYVADIIFDALLTRNTRPSSTSSIKNISHEQDQDLLARDFLHFTKNKSRTSNCSTTAFNAQSTASPMNQGGPVWREHLAKTYRTARRFSVDASQRVSDLLYDKESQAARAQADVKTSRREAEALTSRDLRLSYDLFRGYCESFRHVVHQHKEAWDDLRSKLGLDGLEMLLLRNENAIDIFGDEGTAYLTEQRLYLLQRGGRVTVVRLDAVFSAELLPDDHSSINGSTTSSSVASNGIVTTTLRLALKPGSERVYSVHLQRSQPANDAFLGDYPGGGRPFAGSVLQREAKCVHGGDADLSDVDDDIFQGDKVRRCPQGYYELRLRGSSSGGELNLEESSQGITAVSSSTAHTPNGLDEDSSAPRWLEAMREMMAAIDLASRLRARASWSASEARPLIESAFRFYWQEIRADAMHYDTQRTFFQAETRRLELWVALNFLRRRALRRCCGMSPRQLLVCTQAPDVLRLFLANETEATLAIPGLLVKEQQLSRRLERGWLRTAAAYASRLDELHRKRRTDIETFSAARFRDEWTVFWQHLDPIWDGFFDTIAQIRAYDKPLLSGAFFGGLLLIAVADRLDILPALFLFAYAIAIIENGRRVKARRAKKRNDTPLPSRGSQDGQSVSTKIPYSQHIASASGATVATTIALASLDASQQQKRGKAGPASLETASRRFARLFQRGTHQEVGLQNESEPGRRPALNEVYEYVDNQNESTFKSKAKAELGDVFGVFGQLRDLRTGLGKAQAQLHDYNTSLLACRALHRWTDSTRTSYFVAGLLFAAVCFAMIPLNWLFAAGVCYFGTDPLFERRGLSRAVSDEYFDGLPKASRTHGNVHFAALDRRYDDLKNAFPPRPAFYPPILRPTLLNYLLDMMTSTFSSSSSMSASSHASMSPPPPPPVDTPSTMPEDDRLLRTWSPSDTMVSNLREHAIDASEEDHQHLRRRKQHSSIGAHSETSSSTPTCGYTTGTGTSAAGSRRETMG